jgi:two-component system nitrogen regulation sensor histidine kinase NtrY
VQNAVHAISEREAVSGQTLEPGEIVVTVGRGRSGIYVEVADNGRGLPTELRDRLTDPYVTTRTKGTGLGLAIVKKIMEDHGGELVLIDRFGGGAKVQLVFGTLDSALDAGPEGGAAKVATDGI